MGEIYEVGNDIEAQREISTEENDHASRTGEIAKTEVDVVADSMKKSLAKVPGKPFESGSVTIFRLPSWFHEINKELCEPKMVAIGPYHHGKDSFRTMQEHKWSTLRDFLARNENVGLEVYLQAMRFIEVQARHCYSETVDMGSDDFVKMLILDGCFILEWFLKNAPSENNENAPSENNTSYENDAFFEVGWAQADLLSDMCLLENQIPFFVIHKLLAIRDQEVGCSPNCEDHCPLIELFSDVLECRGYCFARFRPPTKSCNDIHHLLHLNYEGLLPVSQPQTQSDKGNVSTDISHNFCGLDRFTWSKLFSQSSRANLKRSKSSDTGQINIQCVSELRDAGIKFKRKKMPSHMLDISFENGTIEIPLLQMDTLRTIILWNMVAFEQSCGVFSFRQTLSSYLALMDSLINTEKDIAILEQSGIVENYFQNAEAAAVFYNQFGKIFGLDYSDHYFLDFFMDVQKYSESTWHKYRARLMHDYFSNPWSIISFVVAGILLILTFIQTYYSAAK